MGRFRSMCQWEVGHSDLASSRHSSLATTTVVIEQIRLIAHRSQARKLLIIASVASTISLSRRDCDLSALP